MAICTVCNKGKMAGRNVRHKHSGLWERKAPATARLFLPNIQRRALSLNGQSISMKLCTKCLKRIKNFPGWKGFMMPKTENKTEPVVSTPEVSKGSSVNN